MEISRVDGRGLGVDSPRRAVITWVSPLLGAASDIALRSNVAVHVGGFGLVPLARPREYLDELGQVYRPSVIGAKVQVGVVVGLP